MIRTKPPYTLVLLALESRHLNDAQKVLLVRLYGLAPKDGKPLTANARYLADRLGWRERKVEEHRAVLARYGLLRPERHQRSVAWWIGIPDGFLERFGELPKHVTGDDWQRAQVAFDDVLEYIDREFTTAESRDIEPAQPRGNPGHRTDSLPRDYVPQHRGITGFNTPESRGDIIDGWEGTVGKGRLETTPPHPTVTTVGRVPRTDQPRTDSAQPSWSARIIDVWNAYAGSAPIGQLVAALKPVHEQIHDVDRLYWGLAKWLRAGNARFGPHVFARDWRTWVPGGQDGLPDAGELAIAEFLAGESESLSQDGPQGPPPAPRDRGPTPIDQPLPPTNSGPAEHPSEPRTDLGPGFEEDPISGRIRRSKRTN